MPNNQPPPPKAPESPDELNGGLRGRISGVTRVGPKAMGVAAMAVGGLILAIMWGLNQGSSTKAPPRAPTITAAQAPARQESHFGADVPIVATPDPTEAPITLPTNNPDTSTTPSAGAVPNLTPAASRQDASVQQQLQQMREEERRLRREVLDQAIHSKIIASENNQSGNGNAAAAARCVDATGGNGNGGNAGRRNAVQQAQQADQQQAEANSREFLNGPLGQYSCLASAETARNDYLDSQRAVPRSQYEVLAGSIIPADLITGINSELPGVVSAQVREDVYDSKTGKYLLIPRGSRLFGLYRSNIGYGQTRVLVAWTRLIFPDTTGLDLMNMTGADVEGNAGLSGTVDNHYGKIFGAALLTSILSAGLQLSQPQQQSAYPNAQELAAAAASQQILSIGTNLANRALNIAPTVTVPRGYPFVVMVDKDIVFPGAYQGM